MEATDPQVGQLILLCSSSIGERRTGRGFAGLGRRCLSFEAGIGFSFGRPRLTFYLTFCEGILGYQVYYSASPLLIVITATAAGWVEDPSLKILNFSGCLSGAGFASGCKYSSCLLIHCPFPRRG